MCVLSCLSHVQLFVTSWTVAHQAPLSMRFSRQKYWSGLSCPSPGDIPHPGAEPTAPVSTTLQADSLPTEPPGKQTHWFYSIHNGHIAQKLCNLLRKTFYAYTEVQWVCRPLGSFKGINIWPCVGLISLYLKSNNYVFCVVVALYWKGWFIDCINKKSYSRSIWS